MRMYLIGVMGVCFGVDGLLLSGTNRFTDRPGSPAHTALAAGLGALYSGACLLPRFQFLSGTLWRLVSLVVMGTVAFGMQRSSLRPIALFVVLNMAVGGLALILGGEGSIPLCAVLILALCVLALRGRPGAGGCVPVILRHKGRQIRIMALRDTGNTLRDPLTGEHVLVIDAKVGAELLGVEAEQLCSPLEGLTRLKLPGLRLIPYTTVGGRGLLLGMRFADAQVGERRCGALVAFAPAGLDGTSGFQALTGGMV